MKKFKRTLLFIRDNYINISLILFSLIMIIFVILKLEDNVKFNKQEKEYYKNYYLEKGRAIGRNSMLEYLHNNNELKDDTVNIDIQELIKIEEKNQKKMLNRKED